MGFGTANGPDLAGSPATESNKSRNSSCKFAMRIMTRRIVSGRSLPEAVHSLDRQYRGNKSSGFQKRGTFRRRRALEQLIGLLAQPIVDCLIRVHVADHQINLRLGTARPFVDL